MLGWWVGVPVATFFQVYACRCCRCCGTTSGQDNQGVKVGQGVLGAAGGWFEPIMDVKHSRVGQCQSVLIQGSVERPDCHEESG